MVSSESSDLMVAKASKNPLSAKQLRTASAIAVCKGECHESREVLLRRVLARSILFGLLSKVALWLTGRT
jgi:hypothetical protein